MLGMNAAVRAATPDDAPALIGLMCGLAAIEAYLDNFKVDEQALLARAFGRSAQCQVFVGEWHEQVVGYAVVLEIPFTYDLRPTVLLKELYVADHCRSQGLGQALLQHVAAWAQEKGAGRLKWDVLVGNDMAIQFYERLGGVPEAKWLAYQMDSQAIENLAAGCLWDR